MDLLSAYSAEVSPQLANIKFDANIYHHKIYPRLSS